MIRFVFVFVVSFEHNFAYECSLKSCNVSECENYYRQVYNDGGIKCVIGGENDRKSTLK